VKIKTCLRVWMELKNILAPKQAIKSKEPIIDEEKGNK
jgi:hypothetical protein